MRLDLSPRAAYALTAICIAITVSITVIGHFRLPVMDDYALLPFLQKWYTGTLSLKDLFFAGDGHWFFLALLIQLPVAVISHWTKLYEILAILALLLGTWVYLARILSRTAMQLNSAAFYYISLPISTFILWSLNQSGNLFWGWQIATFWSLLSIMASTFYLTEPAMSWREFLSGIFFCSLGIYSYSTGFAFLPIAPILIGASLNSRRNKIIFLAIWCLYSLLMVTHYTYALAVLPHQAITRSIFFYVHFIINFLGAPLVRFAHNASFLVVGAGLIIICLCLGWMRECKSWRIVLPYLTLMLFATGVGCLTVLGRSDFGLAQATVSRYISFSNLFWIGMLNLGLIVIAFPYKKQNYPGQAKWVPGAIGIFIVLMAINSVQIARKNLQLSAYYAQIYKAIQLSYPMLPSGLEVSRLYLPWPEHSLSADLAVMHQYRLNLFRNPAP